MKEANGTQLFSSRQLLLTTFLGAARPAWTLPHSVAVSKLFSAQARTRFFVTFISKPTCFLFPATKCANVHVSCAKLSAVSSQLPAVSLPNS